MNNTGFIFLSVAVTIILGCSASLTLGTNALRTAEVEQSLGQAERAQGEHVVSRFQRPPFQPYSPPAFGERRSGVGRCGNRIERDGGNGNRVHGSTSPVRTNRWRRSGDVRTFGLLSVAAAAHCPAYRTIRFSASGSIPGLVQWDVSRHVSGTGP